ncbi:hypothetical protein BGZ95_004182, partial [Linnemannia exigua]
MEWLKKAADQGHEIALTNVGMLYYQGHGVLQDHDKALEMQKQALGRLVVIQERIQAILTQTCDLHEYPIPRLFIILPKETNLTNLFQFRLYFLCECGEHAKVLNGDDTNIQLQHHIHIAKHEGYDLQRPTEFFQKYGRYMLTLLQMIKYGSTIAGYFTPSLSAVNVSGANGMLTNSQDIITPSAINRSIEYLQSLPSDQQDAAKVTNKDSFAGQGAVEGADLHHLEAFIKRKDQDQALGNLYRTITDEGHVKWICIKHYRLANKEQDQQAFVTAVGLTGGHYNPCLGRVTVSLRSRKQAAGFFKALAKARRVDELVVTFDWKGTMSGLEKFGQTLENAAISILRLDFQRFRTLLASKLESTNALKQALSHSIDLPSMKKIHIILPMDLFELSSLQPKRLSFPPKFSIELVPRQGGFNLGEEELQTLAETLKTNSPLITLDLNSNPIGSNGAVTPSEALKFKLTTLNLYGNSIGDNGAVALSEALKTNSTLTTLSLYGQWIGDNGSVALSEALKTNSTLTTLSFYGNSIGDKGAVALSEALGTNSTLTTLSLYGDSIGDRGAVALSEALKTNSTLTTLSLTGTWIGDKGAVALSEALKINLTLITLNLYSESIRKNEAMVLS